MTAKNNTSSVGFSSLALVGGLFYFSFDVLESTNTRVHTMSFQPNRGSLWRHPHLRVSRVPGPVHSSQRPDPPGDFEIWFAARPGPHSGAILRFRSRAHFPARPWLIVLIEHLAGFGSFKLQFTSNVTKQRAILRRIDRMFILYFNHVLSNSWGTWTIFRFTS